MADLMIVAILFCIDDILFPLRHSLTYSMAEEPRGLVIDTKRLAELDRAYSLSRGENNMDG